MNRRPDRGSTLVELLISITIVGVVLVIIMGAFRIGIRAWETGERDVESSQRLQIVLSMMKRQLASACNRPVPIEGEKPFVFSGESDLLDFVSSVSLTPGNDFGKVRVTYRVRENKGNHFLLEIAERNFLSGVMDQPIDALDDEKIYELIGDAHKLRFEYLRQIVPGEAPDWQPEWDGESAAGLPAAVKCVLQMNEKSPPVAIVARILFEADAS